MHPVNEKRERARERARATGTDGNEHGARARAWRWKRGEADRLAKGAVAPSADRARAHAVTRGRRAREPRTSSTLLSASRVAPATFAEAAAPRLPKGGSMQDIFDVPGSHRPGFHRCGLPRPATRLRTARRLSRALEFQALAASLRLPHRAAASFATSSIVLRFRSC